MRLDVVSNYPRRKHITSVCLCTRFVGLSVYSCGYAHVWVLVGNAWPCWEEWLLYSCLVGAMGARAVSLGSCMDGLRRSPSFIKHTPTCRIDLAKKQGGNSSSSVFPHHKSHRVLPPRERWHYCQCNGPLGQQKGQGENSRSYGDSVESREMWKAFVLGCCIHGESCIKDNMHKRILQAL